VECEPELASRDGDLRVPQDSDWWSICGGADYAEVKAGKKKEVRKVVPRLASGETVYVEEGFLGLAREASTEAWMTPTTARVERMHWLLKSNDGRLAAGGFAMATTGALIDLSLRLGQMDPKPSVAGREVFIDVGTGGVATLTLLQFALLIGGLALVLVKGLLRG
jgi:hypothetical protein